MLCGTPLAYRTRAHSCVRGGLASARKIRRGNHDGKASLSAQPGGKAAEMSTARYPFDWYEDKDRIH
ncbi:MAG: hypothetical protein DWQ47_11035 [Acidobacteria bacterium]|nr:MAG: hypothetical protein DWQ32_13450 [Acidobacteriota bacterium]REJ98113.1 MAG: hypothetical protein DWQ38_16250 [Acidobacteriota bacterium]REK16856.1 MAG: hypothetical protein DWQ43_01295 [Acidobacteriota bacterium]REK42767.1 MAG: hypothetical protein DWQ47_11035 [Acidobacteriota bacterium]